MELRKFISAALSDIVGGVQDAQKEHAGIIVPPTTSSLEDVKSGATAYQRIDFEVQVTVESAGETEGKIGVVAAFVSGSGSKKKSDQSTRCTLLKFGVPVRFPETTPHEQLDRRVQRHKSP